MTMGFVVDEDEDMLVVLVEVVFGSEGVDGWKWMVSVGWWVAVALVMGQRAVGSSVSGLGRLEWGFDHLGAWGEGYGPGEKAGWCGGRTLVVVPMTGQTAAMVGERAMIWVWYGVVLLTI
jgi:hypothetical protein